MQPAAALKRLSRTAQVIFWLFAASLFLLLVSNTGGMRITNLNGRQSRGKTVSPVLFRGFLSAEWILFLMMEPGGTAQRLKSAGGILVKVFFVFCGLCILSELVLGSVGAAQLQAAHTLARLGGLSVFRRFDALHTGIWMLVMLAKLALMIFGAKQALGRLAPGDFSSGTRCFRSICRSGRCMYCIGCAGSRPRQCGNGHHSGWICRPFAGRDKEACAMKRFGYMLLCVLPPRFAVHAVRMFQPQPGERAIVKAIYLDGTPGSYTASLVVFTCEPTTDTASAKGEAKIYSATEEDIGEALEAAEKEQAKVPFYAQNELFVPWPANHTDGHRQSTCLFYR